MCLGPKCSGCLFFIGIWGFLFLGVVGGLFYNESVGLFDDLPKESFEDVLNKTYTERIEDIKDKYQQNAYNSWIAAGANLVIGILGGARLTCIIRR